MMKGGVEISLAIVTEVGEIKMSYITPDKDSENSPLLCVRTFSLILAFFIPSLELGGGFSG